MRRVSISDIKIGYINIDFLRIGITQMSREIRNKQSYKLQNIVGTLERNLKTHDTMDFLSRPITADESIEITMERRQTGLRLCITNKDYTLLDHPYTNYANLKGKLLENPEVYDIFIEKNVAI